MIRRLSLALMSLLAMPALAEEITLDCLADPSQRVAVGSSVTGILRETFAGRGDRVAKGDRLAQLDSTLEQADVAVALAQAEAVELLDAAQTKLAFSEANLERAKVLLGGGSVTQSRIEELEALVAVARSEVATERRRLELARIELERARAVLSLRTLTSPIDGFVIAQGTQIGEFLRQDGVVFTLLGADPLYVETYAPAEIYGRLSVGDKAMVSLGQPAGTNVEASVLVVDPAFDAASGTFGLRLELPNKDGRIPAGQQCRVTLQLAG